MSTLTVEKLVEAKRLMDEQFPPKPKEILITLGLYEKLREAEPGLPEVTVGELPKRAGQMVICNTLLGIGEFCFDADPDLFRSKIRPHVKFL